MARDAPLTFSVCAGVKNWSTHAVPDWTSTPDRFVSIVVAMTSILNAAPVVAPLIRRPIITRPLLIRFVSIVALSFSYFLPLAAIPVFTNGLAAGGAAGFANGALLISTVIGEVVAPWILAHTGYRAGLAVGLLALGVPALALMIIPTLPIDVLVCAIRGFGFGLAVVAGGALTASIVPPERRGEALAVTGVVSGVPSLIAMPLGVWLAYHGGIELVFLLTGLVPMVATVSLRWLPNGPAPVARENGILRGLRQGGLMRPAVVFAMAAAAAGALVTYLPLAFDRQNSWLASTALFIQPTCTTIGIWIAGRLSDRHPRIPLLVPAIVLGAIGMAALAAVHSSLAVLVGAVAFGLAFGILDNATITRMYSRVTPTSYGTVSALWNASYDGGMAIGAAAVGMFVTGIGISGAFVLVAATMLPTILLVIRDGRATSESEAV